MNRYHNRAGLDEKQRQDRERIGSQSFILLLYLLMLDAGLYGFGFRWAAYPANVMVLVTLSAGIYVARLIAAGAYIGPARGRQRPLFKAVATVLVAAAVSFTLLLLLRQADFTDTERIDAMASPVLFISGGAALAVSLLVLAIRRRQDRDGE